MASKNARSSSTLEQCLFSKKARSLDFYQALSLLKKLATQNGKKIKVLPKPGREFSGTAIDEIIEQDDSYIVIANLLGLYSSGSPLPNYYLDEILTQINNNELQTKAFLDIFHQRIYQLLYEAWEENNLPLQLFLKKDLDLEETLYSIAGISFGKTSNLLERIPRLKKYLVHFMGGNRTLLSLQNLLTDFFGTEFEIQSFYSAQVDINSSQQNKLGKKNSLLGRQCYLGELHPSKSNNIHLKLANMCKQLFDGFLPGGPLHEQLCDIVKTFLTTPLNCYFSFSLAADDIQGSSLGGDTCNRLGQEAWLSKHAQMQPHSFTCQLKLNN